MKVEKPWGYYKQYAYNKTCSVKLLTLNSNEETSLHWHNLRSDAWVVLDEGVRVQIGEEFHDAKVGEEFFIPSGTVHRLMSVSDQPARVLEIAFGYNNEDDNHRIADDYGRELEI
jgi:mannose-1-phosphate guanylyltransferase/mannose-6-phosphate isomerase